MVSSAYLKLSIFLLARILEWVAILISRGSSWPRDQTWISHIAGRYFIVWATREAPYVYIYPLFFGSVSHRKHGRGCQSTACTSSPHLRAINNVFCFQMQADSSSKTATPLIHSQLVTHPLSRLKMTTPPIYRVFPKDWGQFYPKGSWDTSILHLLRKYQVTFPCT